MAFREQHGFVTDAATIAIHVIAHASDLERLEHDAASTPVSRRGLAACRSSWPRGKDRVPEPLQPSVGRAGDPEDQSRQAFPVNGAGEPHPVLR